MSRKLILLDALLVIVLIYAGVRFRNEWKAAKAREAATAHARVRTPPVPPLPKIDPPPPVTPSTYADIAQKFLLDKSRNPNVPVEPPKPAPPPPPPPPPPPLPSFHGVMMLPSGPVAVLSAGGESQGVHIGERIGQYVLTDIGNGVLTFEWDGQKFVKSTDELDHGSKAAAGPAQAAPAPERTANTAPPPPPEPVKPGPGAETPYGIRVCNMNDGMPEGAVMDGYIKRVYTSPFGKTCGWERVR